MEQLTGVENLYLNLEADGMPMHVSLLTIYDRSSASGGRVEFRDLQRFFAERAHRSPVFRRRLVTLPLSLARPYWIDDRSFDIEFHLRHIALPKPGDWRQLCTQVARLHARPLDRGRPLWECYVIEELDGVAGLPRGSFALATKVHYAALGGPLGGQLFAALHELAPDSRASPPKHRVYFDRHPTVIDLALRSAVDALKWPSVAARTVVAEAMALAAFGASEVGAAVRRVFARDAARVVARGARIPRTPFNGRVSPHRVTDGVRLPHARLERIRAAIPGATVDDVAIAIIGGALRAYLDGRIGSVDATLTAEAPIAVRREMRLHAGRMFADSALRSLHSDVADPSRRLAAVVADTHRLRASRPGRLARRLMLETIELIPAPIVAIAGDALRRSRLGSRLPPLMNTAIATLRGPDVALYLGGARLVACYAQAAVHDLAGLVHVVGHCDGATTITATACRAMLPDPEHYAACLHAAERELGAAVGIDVVDADLGPRARTHRRRTASSRGRRRSGAHPAIVVHQASTA